MNTMPDFVQSKNEFVMKINELLTKLSFDDNTYKHSLNVAKYSKKFNELLKTDINSDIIYYSGLFHDIGKTKVDFNIINKNGILCNDEFNIIKRHSKLGYDIMKKYYMPEEMLCAAYYHHERWDGKGYPLKLKKQEIPFVSRIISICDVFDALTSDRPYRKAFSVDETVDIMKNSHGQFDEELLKIFMDKLDSIAYINEF